MEETDRDTWENGTEGVAIFNSAQWEEELNLRTAYTMNQSRDNIRFCKIETESDICKTISYYPFIDFIK